jgi:hypothetical protein
MIAVNWTDVGCPAEACEREVAGILVLIESEHIIRWKEDPDGVWEVEKIDSSPSSATRRYTLDQWHPSKEEH